MAPIALDYQSISFNLAPMGLDYQSISFNLAPMGLDYQTVPIFCSQPSGNVRMSGIFIAS